MIHWSKQTHLSFARDEATRNTWQFVVPEEALSHRFLMHGLLAISALELASHGDDFARSQYVETAVMHQNESLKVFRGLLSQINRVNAKAIFAFSSILVVYSFGFLHLEKIDSPSMTIEDLYHILMLCRGIQQVIASSKCSILDSNFGSILEYNPVKYPWRLTVDGESALHQLCDANITFGANVAGHDTEVYDEAINSLGEALNATFQDHIPRNVVSRWAIKLPQAFLCHLQRREPMALAILGVFCVVLHRLRSVWYFQEWGETIMKLIWQTLDSEWRILVNWGMLEVFGELHLDAGVE